VDYMDKVVSFARIRLKRCKKRYHRAIFLWHLSVVGFHNTKIVWEILLGEEVVKELEKKHGRFGFSHWVQKELANGLIVYGTRMAIQAEILSSIAERAATPTSGSNSPTSVAHTFPATPTRGSNSADENTPGSNENDENRIRMISSPHHMPSRKKVRLESPVPVSMVPVTHKYEYHYYIMTMDVQGNPSGKMARNYCVVCLSKSVRVAGRGNSRMPKRADGSNCPKPYKGCSVCKVSLCEKCHVSHYDHKNNRPRLPLLLVGI
jgi:hypothetical protein